MRAVLQRVSEGAVEVDGACVASIGAGWLVFLGVARTDRDEDAFWIAEKIANLRGFEDDRGKMNRSVVEAGGSVLIVSQFTLMGDCRAGRRPDFGDAAPPEAAERLYQLVVARLRPMVREVATGVFRAMMKVELVNDGPVTFLLDSRRQF
jgi:D-tyrosyl-tRNA(Tyr) deacylase